MKGSVVLKSLVAVLLVWFLPKSSLADGGKPTIVFPEILVHVLQDTTIPVRTKAVVNTKGKKKAKTIKVLPKTHRQPVPVPLNVKVPKVKIIKPVVKPVIKILR
jgi:hypothetical protein